MDVLRSCYSRPCRFYRDQTIPTRIVWYFCDDGALPLGRTTVFWPYSQVKDVHNVDGGIGEDTSAQIRWRNGSKPWPSLIGDHVEGTDADFRGLSNAPASARGGEPQLSDRAECEDHTALEMTGGIVDGTLSPIVLRGGEAEGGTLIDSTGVRLFGGEIEGGALRAAPHLTGAFEREGGNLRPAPFLRGGEVESGDVYDGTLRGGEVEGGDARVVPFLIAGEVESGDVYDGTLRGGEVEGGTLVLPVDLVAGEIEGGDCRPAPHLVAGETEGGHLFDQFLRGGEVEGTYGIGLPIAGGEAEGGDLIPIDSPMLLAGEVHSWFDFSTIFDPDLWLDALDFTLSQGDAISTWADKSGNGNDATQSTGAIQPFYDPSGGTAPCARFNTGDQLNLTSPVGGGTQWTTYVVIRPATNDQHFGGVLGSNTDLFAVRPYLVWFPATADSFGIGIDSAFIGHAWFWQNTRSDIISARRNGDDFSTNGDGFFPNGTNLTTSSQPTKSVSVLGAYGFFLVPYDGWIYEVMCFERAVSNFEDHLFVSMLHLKWGIPI